MLKRFVVFLVIVTLTMLIFSSCNYDLYYGKRPYDYGSAKWESDDPSMFFTVNCDLDKYHIPEGELLYDDLTLNFRLMFGPETNLVSLRILDYEDDIGFLGECEFSPEKLIIKIDKKSDNLFYGKYDKIIFYKTEL